MASGVNVKMGVSGVAQFKQSINQSKQAIKTLDAQLALSEKQFKASGDAESYMAEKSELLKAKLEQQKSIAENAEKALKDMAEKGADRGSKAYQDLYQQMLAAKGAMLDTESEMQGVGSAGNEAAEGVSNMNEQLKSVDTNLSWQNVNTALESITNGMEAAMKKAIELGKVIVKEVLGAGNWADDLHTRATYFGISDEELQRMEKTATLIDTPVDAIINARKKLKKAVAGGNEDIFEALGLDPAAAANSEDLFWKVGAALMKLGDEYTQEEYAQKMFGRSWNELIPLFEAGRKEYDKLNESWSVVPEENLKQLQEMGDQYQILKNDLETTKNLFLSELAPAVKSVMEVMTGLVGKFNEYLQTENGQQMMEALSNAVSSMFEDLSNIDPDKVMNTIIGVLDTIKTSLQWIANNKTVVVDAVKAFIGAWALLEGAKGVTTVLQLINGIKGLTAGSAAAEAGAAGAAAGASWGSAFAAAVTKAAPWLAGIYTLLNPAEGAGDQLDSLYDENGNPTQANIDLQNHKNNNGLLWFGTPEEETRKNWNERVRKNQRQWEEHQDAIINGSGNADDGETILQRLGTLLDEAIYNTNPAVESPAESHEGTPGNTGTLVKELSDGLDNAVERVAKRPNEITVILDGHVVKTYIDQALGAQLAGLFG
jgi:hypothetical protein